MIKSTFLIFFAAGLLRAAVVSPSITFEGMTNPTRAELKDSKLGSIPLFLTGRGIRERSIAFFTAKVYAAESFISQSLDGVTTMDQRLAAIRRAPVKVLRLTFLRDVSAEKVREAFRQALQENGLPTEEGSPYAAVLNSLVTDLKEHSVLLLTGRTDGLDQILTLQVGSQIGEWKGLSLVDGFWKIWFGESKDSGLAALRKALVG